MMKSRFLDSQIVTILKQAESGSPVPKLCSEHNIRGGPAKLDSLISDVLL